MPEDGKWEARLDRTDAALAAIAAQLTALGKAVGVLQQQEDADLAETKKQKEALDARFAQQQQALSAVAAQIATLRTEEAAAETKQDADWQARFAQQQQALTVISAQLGTLGQAVDVLQTGEVEQTRLEKEKEEAWDGRFRHQEESMGAIYGQLVEVRKGVESMQAAAQEVNLRRRREVLPVHVGDLMRGFQSAVSRANHSARAGEGDGEDIEHMAIKDLEVSMQAPVIDQAHAEDPILMLPNINSADRDTASVTIKFNVVTLPAKQR
jgi:chromosome segregation ATPase